jgi:hypothetical protein
MKWRLIRDRVQKVIHVAFVTLSMLITPVIVAVAIRSYWIAEYVDVDSKYAHRRDGDVVDLDERTTTLAATRGEAYVLIEDGTGPASVGHFDDKLRNRPDYAGGSRYTFRSSDEPNNLSDEFAVRPDFLKRGWAGFYVTAAVEDSVLSPNPDDKIHWHFVAVPLWGVAGIIFLPTALWLISLFRRRRPGMCVKCGYDLRATPGRCPECGTEQRSRRSNTKLMN